MLEFHLYRIRVSSRETAPLLSREGSPPEILQSALLSLPEADTNYGRAWRVGNIARIDKASSYFRIGRTSPTTLSMYDDNAHSFRDVEYEDAPYTHAVIDFQLGLTAIAKHSRLAKHTVTTARRLGRLLDRSAAAEEFDAKFEIGRIKDPDEFLRVINTAVAIRTFSFTFSRPNPIDTSDVTDALKNYLKESNGHKGRNRINGQELNATTLEEMTREASSAGEDASARVVLEEGGTPTTKHLQGGEATVQCDDEALSEDLQQIAEAVRSRYNQIRQGNSQQRQ